MKAHAMGFAIFLALAALLLIGALRAGSSSAAGPGATAVLALPDVVVAPGAQVTVPVTLALDQGAVYSVDLAITYDPSVATAISVTQGAIATGFSLASNLSVSGLIRIAMAGAEPITTDGELVRITFQAVGASGSTTILRMTQGQINEGALSGSLTNGSLAIAVESPFQTLTAGWNLIGLPLRPASAYTAESLLDEIAAQGGDCNEIDRWLNGGWSAHLYHLPFNDFHLALGEGYFIKCARATNWRYWGGNLAAPQSITLMPGWNLVAFPKLPLPTTAQSLLDEIIAQGGSCSEIDRWVNGGWEAHINGYPFNNFQIESNAGYFLKCDQHSTYTPGGTSS
ncbi:MAG: hypothetical protein J7M34_08120 [Anaerolineae bacterium]|nr:hypothetical protein [Anaerolineae bacterium]